MERVSVINNPTSNIIIVAPHGADDTHTDIVAETIANEIKANAVINRGFERASYVDSLKDKANCNNVDHLVGDEVVKQEFLDPIVKMKNRFMTYAIKKNLETSVMIYHIHGMGKGNIPTYVLGYGLGLVTNSLSMLPWRAHYLYDLLVHAYFGEGGGKYAGRQKTNLNQYFRKWELDEDVESIQIEISASARVDESTARKTGLHMAKAIEKASSASTYYPTHSNYLKI